MRNITRLAVKAFFNRERFSMDNTKVTTRFDAKNDTIEQVFYLHGHAIAQLTPSGVILSNCGWQTNTTKERLNGILEHMGQDKIRQVKGVWYQNGTEWVNGRLF